MTSDGLNIELVAYGHYKNINCTSNEAVSMKSLSAKYMEVGPYLYEIKADGSYNVSADENGNYNGSFATGINAAFFGQDAALNMRILVAALYLVAAVMQFVGLALVYNLDKKTLAKMNEDLAARKSDVSAEEVDPELV